MTHLIRHFFLVVLFIIGTILWFFRGYYLFPFNPQYMNDYYDHSQWTVPQSIRVMGDESRYEVGGYRLVHGGKLYTVAPEVPPLGMYLIGASQLLFQRSTGIILFFGLLFLYGFYLLSKEFFSRPNQRVLALLILLLSPNVVLIFQRITLDVMQVTALIFHIYFILRGVRSSNGKFWFYLLAGLCCGLFVSFKFGLFIIPLLIADIYLLHANKQTRYLFLVLLIVPSVYILSTASYFLDGGTISAWIGAQKWIARFYLDSNTGFIPGMALVTSLTGLYRGWWGHGWEFSEDWSVVMLLGFVSLFVLIFLAARKNLSFVWKYLLLYTMLTFTLLCFIAFWPRYLLLISPFFALFITYLLFFIADRYRGYTIGFLLLVLGIHLVFVLRPQPDRFLTHYEYMYSHSLYQDLYSSLNQHTISAFSRDDYWKRMLDTHTQLGIYSHSISITSRFVYPWENSISLPARVTYTTDVGVVTHSYMLHVVRVHNQWRVSWSWDYVLPYYSPSSLIHKVRLPGKEGRLLSSDGSVLAEGGNRLFAYALPKEIPDLAQAERDLAESLDLKPYMVSKLVLENSPPDRLVPLGFIAYGVSNSESVCSYQGITCISLSDRIIHSTEKIDEVISYERKYASQLRAVPGGSISLYLDDGTVIPFFSQQPRDGEDVIIH